MDAGLVVPIHDPSHGNCSERTRGNTISFSHIPFHELEISDAEGYEAMVELFKPLANNLLGDFTNIDWTVAGKYIRNVITFGDDREREDLRGYLINAGSNFPRSFFAFSFDNDHVHVLHNCPFSSNQCKCLWRKNLNVGQLVPGYPYKSDLREWGRSDFLSTILYFFYRKGSYKETWFSGRRKRLENSRKYNSASGKYPIAPLYSIVKGVQWHSVEEEVRRILGASNERTGGDLQARECDGDRPERLSQSRKRRSGWQTGGNDDKRRKTKWEIIQGKIGQLLEETAICPLEGIKSEWCFIKDLDLTDPMNQCFVNKAIEIWSHKINLWTLRQFYEMYERTTHENLLFSKSKSYMKLDESVNVIDKLLKYQFNDDEVEIVKFLQNLVNVLDRQPEDNPNINIKCNTFLVHSQPSAGKNFFFDCIFTLLLNFGQLGTANKSNNFAFQDAANRRVILWNEPNYEPSMTDYLKTLFEGGDTKVRVKMSGDTHVQRTPIIILTNNTVNFMIDPAFKDRIVQYKWRAAPFLKEYNQKPYPLVFFNILLKYSIKF